MASLLSAAMEIKWPLQEVYLPLVLLCMSPIRIRTINNSSFGA